MNSFMLIMVQATLMAANGAPYWGNVPEGVRTFVITYPGEEVRDYGALQLDGEWVTESTPDIADTQQVTVIYDYPWADLSPDNTMFRNIHIDPEPKALRAKRIEQGYREAGYILLDLEDGVVPVPERDLELAERAATLAKEHAGEAQDATETGAEVVEPSEESAMSISNPTYRWGAHVGIVLIAGLSLLAVYRYSRSA